MHVIAARTVRQFSARHADARKYLAMWLAVVEHAEWRSLEDIRRDFAVTDSARVASGNIVYIFDIRGNKYRLICAVHFNRQKIYTLRFMTHAEYSKGTWKDSL